ncbi:hypothetical protein ACVIVD_003824 [Bradyrhizobium liaoningense]
MESEVLAERPVLVEQGHADRGIGVQHLLGRDDLDLVRIDVEPEILQRHLFAGIGDALQGVEIPIGAFEQSFRHGAVFSWAVSRRWNKSWNTGKISLRSETLRIESGAPLLRRRS